MRSDEKPVGDPDTNADTMAGYSPSQRARAVSGHQSGHRARIRKVETRHKPAKPAELATEERGGGMTKPPESRIPANDSPPSTERWKTSTTGISRRLSHLVSGHGGAKGATVERP